MMIKIDSMQFIPMNKESIFEDPVPPTETYSITFNVQVWQHHWKAYEQSSTLDSEFRLDVAWEFAEQLVPSLQGYMLGPVALLEGKEVLAKTIGVQAPRAVIEHFSSLNDEGYDVFLYSVSRKKTDPSSHYVRYGVCKR
jgi:hypothetical protein